MRAAALLLMLLSIPGVAAAPVLHAVVADLPGSAPGDEAFAITTDEPWDISGFNVTDGEGTWTAPTVTLLDPGEILWVTGNHEAWSRHGGPPALVWSDSQLRLANDGDQLQLLDGETLLDEVAWGDQGPLPRASPGVVWQREDGDWIGPRVHRVGQSDLPAPIFRVNAVTAYASPDSAYPVLRDLIDGAQDRLALHVYALGHGDLAERIAQAASRGVNVSVLLDGNVVGANSREREATAYYAGRIVEAGGTVLETSGGRYAHQHLKVLLVDDSVAVQSENWVETGVPASGSYGNRGWGMVVHNAAMADWFAQWMADDRAAWDAQPAPTSDQEPVRLPQIAGYHHPTAPATLHGAFTVRPLISPDHTARDDLLTTLLGQAESRIWVQQLRMQTEERNLLGWSQPDRFVAALADAADRDVWVEVHLAEPFGRDDTDNLEVASALRRAGVAVEIWDHRQLGTLHNKGWIIDDQVVVGSMNGNHHSRSENREVTLVVEGAAVADYYAKLFASDRAAHDRLLPGFSVPMLLVATGLAALLWRPCCRPSPSLQSPSS